MNPDVKAKWVARLRELPNEMQARGVLKDEGGKMCCLGVLCELAVEEGVALKTDSYTHPHLGIVTKYDEEWTQLPQSVVEWAGTETALPYVDYDNERNPLTYLNDAAGRTFDEIADYIEGSRTGEEF